MLAFALAVACTTTWGEIVNCGSLAFRVPAAVSFKGATIAERTLRVEAWRWQQSEFWRCCSGPMLADPVLWRYGWPIVKREAAGRVVRTRLAEPGEQVTLEALPPGSYRIVLTDDRGNRGAPSGWARVP